MIDSCAGLFLGLQGYSIEQPICFLANTMQFLLYYCYIIQLEIRDGDTSKISFIVEDFFSYPVLCFVLFCPDGGENSSFKVWKNYVGIN